MFFDTHCHLNYKTFKKTYPQVIAEARKAGVVGFIVPGSDIKTSYRAVDLASEYEGLYAACGIHPHHLYTYQKVSEKPDLHKLFETDLSEISGLFSHEKVVAIGEIGLDHYYNKDAHFSKYVLNEDMVELQKGALIKQIELAKQYRKAIMLHNRLATEVLLECLRPVWTAGLHKRVVFHCCEPRDDLLTFAQEHGIYIGVDGDVTYSKEKQRFIKKVPLELLVLETDSPYLLPEPLRTQRLYPNTPINIPVIAQCVSDLTGVSVDELAEVTTANAQKLFMLS